MNDDVVRASRQRLTEYLYDQARWRDLIAEENPDDDRNRRSAEGLRSLATYLQGLDDDDERLYTIAALAGDPDEPLRVGEEAERLTRRYLFDLRNESPDAWLDRFVGALARDREDVTDPDE